ncbi:MAG: hypothetical protein MUF21_13785 [Gemmatimonadaceae bacterium]|nr:hypothetical protein [Gemmatimonadaceae bacterium]
MSRSLVGRTIRRVALLAALGVASSAVPRLVAAQAQLKLSVAVQRQASGPFTVRMEMKCTSQSADDGFLEVTFTAIDETSKRRATARENATPWICR